MPASKSNTTLAAATKTNCASPLVATTHCENVNRAAGKAHKRSRSGCFTCRLRRKKCDEGHPACKACINLNLKCEYKRPMWWASAEQRRMQKERVKNKIKHTKSLERRGSRENGEHAQYSQTSPSLSEEGDFSHASFVEPYDPFINNMPMTSFQPHIYPAHYAPYEIDVRTERQTFVNDMPLRHDSSVSTYSAMGPPYLHATLPAFHTDEWLKEECFNQTELYGHFDPPIGQHSSYSITPHTETATIHVDEHDRAFLDHFVENVIRMIFPIIEVHQLGAARARSILHSLETNKSYLHCCLSVSAIHLKTTAGLSAEQIDHDIMRHRYEAIAQLCQALNHDTDHEKILDATLAMIFFHCSVGVPDDYLPDIPWDDHFQAASNLVNRLKLPSSSIRTIDSGVTTPFSMSLTTWIDILGATMLGKTPQFAHSYRSKHLTGTPSGLRELMGCDDRIMYLISEIACLDSLKNDGRIDEIAICQHVSALGAQLEHTEPADPTLSHPYTPSGTFRVDVLTKTMSTIFRLAARIYLCSLVPGFDRSQPSNLNLIEALTNALQFIPAGPYGFDRSLVWPLLMAGAFSTPESSFRSVLEERTAALGEIGDFGSFGRMYRVLHEVWRLSDDCPTSEPPGVEQIPVSESTFKPDISKSPDLCIPGMRSIKKQSVHWREIMHRNGWRYLLL